MHPAFSVIFLTTLIGAGQGLFLALYTEEIYAAFNVLTYETDSAFQAFGSLIALVLLGLGLFASFFHLGHPERAWRAAAMWRTSWLSREVIVLPAFMVVVSVYGGLHFMGWTPVLFTLGGDAVTINLTQLVGLFGSVLAFLLFISTGMIYAALKFLREWHTPLTVINYTLLGMASGFTLAAAYATLHAPHLVLFYAGWGIVLILVGLVFRGAALLRNARIKPVSTVQTATGIRHPRVRQKHQGFEAGSFNTREFFHHARPVLFRGVKWVFLVLAFLIPVLLLATGLAMSQPMLVILAFPVQYLGLLFERWFFFAQANHPQNLYYQLV